MSCQVSFVQAAFSIYFVSYPVTRFFYVQQDGFVWISWTGHPRAQADAETGSEPVQVVGFVVEEELDLLPRKALLFSQGLSTDR